MDYGKNIRENSCFPSPWLCSLKSPFKLGKWHRVAQAKAAPPLTLHKFEEGNQVTTAKFEAPTDCTFSLLEKILLFSLNCGLSFKKTPKFHPGNF